MAGIYIHIPFCKRKCVYCDFYSTSQFEKYSEFYLDAAVREMEGSADYLGGDPVKTIYFGGGTPSLYKPEGIGRLVETVKAVFGTHSLTETTFEANPEDITSEYLSALKDIGIDRLSIGIQSFDDDMLSFMKRRHDAAKAELAVSRARKAGFGNISIDLIYGIPGLTPGLWEKTLEKALSLNPEHISAYHLTFEPQTKLGRMQAAGKVGEIPQELSRLHFEILQKMLVNAGYDHYEVSNFARPGYRSLHNSSYWTGEKYLGIGPGAHSFNGMQRRWCGMSVAEYVEEQQTVYGSETLMPDDIYNELIMTSLRCADGLTLEGIARRAGERYTAYFLSLAEKLVTGGLLQTDGNKYYISPKDFLTSDNVISSLFI